MKIYKHFKPVILILSFLTLISCSKDNGAETQISLNLEEFTFSGGANSNVLIIDANADWSATVSASWLSIAPTSGTKGVTQMKLTVPQNNTVAQRTATITITAGSVTKVVSVTQKTVDMLVFSQKKFSLTKASSDISLTVQSSVSGFTYVLPDWITLKSASTDNTQEVFTVSDNKSVLARTGYIVYTAGAYKDTVTVAQTGQDATIASDNSGMSSSAMSLSARLGIGWNLGNALEACTNSTSASETLWGNPKTTQALIDAVKAAGFTTVRIPCAWSGYIENDSTYRIKDSWMARVKEVVDYCINDGLYVILNSHWDGGWRDDNPTYASQVAINKKQKAIWQQIAVYFRDYDEHLMFAGTNEVHVANNYNAPTTENSTVQMSFNQTFVDAVRGTGGKNTYRDLIVQSYNTNISYANTYLSMPADATLNRLMVEVHFYDPYDFTLQTTSGYKTQWGQNFVGGDVSTWGQESWVDQAFGIMKTKFVNNQIPVVLGEFGAILRTDLPTDAEAKHVQARNYYLNYVTKRALTDGMVPIYWDNGGTGNLGTALIDRSTNTKVHTDAINAIMSAKN